MKRLAPASIALVALGHGALTGRWIGSGIVLAALLVAVVVPARAAVSGFVSLMLTTLTAAAGGVVGWVETPAVLPQASLARGWTATAVACLFAAAWRSFVKAPEGGYFATSLLSLTALMVTGESRSGLAYPALVVAYLALSLSALRAHDDARPKLRALPPRVLLLTVLQIAVALAAIAVFAVVLPPAAAWSRDRILLSLGEAQTGLGDRMVLGSLEGMLQSDEIVARVYGPRTDYLRGVVYNQYQAGQWAMSATEELRKIRPETEGQGSVRVVLSGATRASRYLVPLGASHVSPAESSVLVDPFGALRPERATPTEIRFDLQGAAAFPPKPPTADDLRIPVKLARAMAPLIHQYTDGLTTNRQKVDSIADHLRKNFRYSLDYKRGPGDPLLDFLGANRLGHCEYFASAMAMLARASGIPARVVAGYRVAEHNDIGDYDVIRERNAHAWVEAYVDDEGWQTIDATPEDLLPQNQPHDVSLFASLWDVARVKAARAADWLAQLTIAEIVAGLGGVIVTGLVVRWLSRRAGAKATTADAFFLPEAPPPPLVELLASLSTRGLARADSEPLERFARRLEDANRPEEADVLLRYAAYRYGGIGDADSLFREMRALASSAESKS
ncbi:MAG: transglutaminaseTgpA domain-containing protein [Polyangiaceae bacterium]